MTHPPRKLLAAAACALALTASACGSDTDSGSGSDGSVKLTIASWGDPFTSATREHLVKPFTEETGYEVDIVDAPGKFVANLEAQTQANNVEWDLLDSTSGPDAYIAHDRGLIATMPDDVKERLLEELPEDAVTDFGISWSVLGYVGACNAEAVDTCPTDTAGLFDTEEFPGSRTSISTSPLVNLSMAEIANGVTIDELPTHEIDLDRAFETLTEFQDASGAWWSSGDQNLQVFESGEAELGISYSGRAYGLIDSGTPVEVIWQDGLYNPGFWNVTEGSDNPDEAWEFVEWIASHPENAAAWAEALGYSVPNPESFDFIDEKTAKTLADFPENREKLGLMNYAWYVENYEEVNKRWQEFLRG
ncbi:extracellular solute-binding protein [Nocardioides caldifontis]|uniref:extracellular solute-binding protein n=1 Tax=Nocardioides caldifontis TaxID=2588938 RepID=UPI0011E05797|nr:extracellular solute-binding protein [Nocardioides caldifontis]